MARASTYRCENLYRFTHHYLLSIIVNSKNMITYFNPLQLFFLVIFPSTFVEFLLTTSVFKKFCTQWYGFIYGLCEILSGFIFAKKLFANEKHSYTETIPFNVFMVSFTGAYFFAILNWIATQWHSRAISVPFQPVILC